MHPRVCSGVITCMTFSIINVSLIFWRSPPPCLTNTIESTALSPRRCVGDVSMVFRDKILFARLASELRAWRWIRRCPIWGGAPVVRPVLLSHSLGDKVCHAQFDFQLNDICERLELCVSKTKKRWSDKPKISIECGDIKLTPACLADSSY